MTSAARKVAGPNAKELTMPQRGKRTKNELVEGCKDTLKKKVKLAINYISALASGKKEKV